MSTQPYGAYDRMSTQPEDTLPFTCAVRVHRDVTHRCVAESAELEISFLLLGWRGKNRK